MASSVAPVLVRVRGCSRTAPQPYAAVYGAGHGSGDSNEKEDQEKKMSEREQYTPGPARGAQIRKEGDKWTLILVRELRHSPEKVWEALTDPVHLREWAPFDADGNLGTVGTTVKLTTVGAPALRITETTVKRADAPNVLEYTWGDFDMRWELKALIDGGTRLTLWTNIGHRFIAMGAAGWHICFDVLDHLLSGTPIGRMVGPEAIKFGGWQRLNAEYAKQFGIESPNWPPQAPQKP
ncbi:MAG TPA: SRPBCC family protein [Terriglobales bacterium]|nr:SRPBCC family protein [Terriglobales bacterium]